MPQNITNYASGGHIDGSKTTLPLYLNLHLHTTKLAAVGPAPFFYHVRRELFCLLIDITTYLCFMLRRLERNGTWEYTLPAPGTKEKDYFDDFYELNDFLYTTAMGIYIACFAKGANLLFISLFA